MTELLDNRRESWLSKFDGKTRKLANNSLAAFDTWLLSTGTCDKMFITEILASNDTKTIYHKLNEIVNAWNIQNKLSPRTIRTYLGFLRSFLRWVGINTSAEELRFYVKVPKVSKEEKYALDRNILKAIMIQSGTKYQTLFLCLLASGMRIKEMLSLKKSWIDLSLMKEFGLALIKIPAIPTKGQAARFTFLTKEAWTRLEPYYRNKVDDKPMFYFTYQAVQKYIDYVRDRLGIQERYSTGVHKLTVHTFRSFTRTVLSDKCGIEFAFYLLGQGAYLGQYYRKSYSDAAALYKKAEPELSIGFIESVTS